MSSIRRSIAVAVLAVIALSSTAFAQGDMRSRMTINMPAGLGSEIGHFPRGAPGTSTGSPIAFGANFHDLYFGLGYQAPLRYSNDADGGLSLGAGLGNSTTALGLDVTVNALSTVRSGVGNRMGLGAKVHRIIDGTWGVAFGMQGLLLNGKRPDDPDASFYGVVSRVINLNGSQQGMFEALTLSFGAGNKAFRTERDIAKNSNNLGYFGSVALRVASYMSVITDWNQDLSVGVSFVPFTGFPLVLTPAVADLTGNAGVTNSTKVSRPRFTLGAGFAVKY